MDPSNVTLNRTYNLSVWLAKEASSLLEVYSDLQGFSDPPPGLPASKLQLPVAPDEDWDHARRLGHRRAACLHLAARLRQVLGEQRELNETRHHLHQQLQFAITGLEGLVANLGLILSSLGSPAQGGGAAEGGEEEDGGNHGSPSPTPGMTHWEAKVKGYHIIAHYSNWISRMVEDLERLKDNLEPEA
ncbi:cardiotrophin-2-like [Scyliorhinus canicula]|uniref:cardiotrophin-2-like n=1 Tax=Scyliorhinus canicula TaxID=7830 RepID=UPI0018F6FADA|nr:cardiotrophin-2-like [Scyliorhinus canicula]